jgi:hypothetical protein
MSCQEYQLPRDYGFKFFVNGVFEKKIKNCRINILHCLPNMLKEIPFIIKQTFNKEEQNVFEHSEQPIAKLRLLFLGSNLRPQTVYTDWKFLVLSNKLWNSVRNKAMTSSFLLLSNSLLSTHSTVSLHMNILN